MLKLYKDNYEKNNKINIKNLSPDDKKKLVIMATTYGMLTVLGVGLLSLTGCGKTVETHYIPPRHSLVYEKSNEINNTIIDFENYDLTSMDRFISDLGSLYNTEEAINYRIKYEDIVIEKASKWGIDPNLAMAILTQESRGANTSNIMQINFNVWQGESFKVYDFENNKYVDILLTEDPVLYNSDKYLTINKQNLENPKTNISIGLAMLQYCIKRMNYDIPAGTQCYNYGPTSMDNLVFAETYTNTYRTRESLLSDQYDFSFMNYTYAYDKGDNDYFYHVARFLNPDEYNIKVKKPNEFDTVSEIVFDYGKLKRELEQFKEENKETIMQ